MAKIIYGLIFCMGVPLILWQWAVHSSVDLALALPGSLALTVAIIGILLCIWSMASLISLGKGLPMNAFPPTKFVQRGPYVLFAHPIYVGFCLLVYGLAAYFHSSSGFYLVAPVVILGALALAMGYENFDMKKRFPFLRYEPFVGLIEKSKEIPDGKDKIRFVLTMYLLTLFVVMQAIGQYQGYVSQEAFQVLFIYALFVLASVWFISSYTSLRAMGVRLFVLSIVVGLLITHLSLIVGALLALISPYALKGARRFFENLANSWHAWRVGNVRVINHGLYAGGAALLGFVIWDVLTPRQVTGPIFLLSLLGLAGAGIWGQILEGSGRLKRPFGYFGALFGGALGLFAMMASNSPHIWIIYGTLAIAFCFAQGFGRLRCLVNGCCHGAIAPDWVGIYIWHPESRVSKISSLAQKPVYPSQIYSGLILIASGALLWWMYINNAHLALIVGMYLILSGIGRFLEEATRGEVQTKIIAGLRIYQWLALLMVALGIVITCLDSPLSPGGVDLGALLEHVPFYLAITALFTLAFGIDFPGSRRRFSEL